jgi:DNA-binding CsgD family transcriptional regulator
MDVVAFVRPATPFVARAPELARLRELIEAAGQGTAAAVLVAGDAGVGKTSLVSEATRRAADEGALVMLGRCVDLGTGALPYLPFVEAFTSLVRENEAAAAVVRTAVEAQPALRRIAGRTEADDGNLDRLALFEAEVRLLTRLGDEIAPVVLVLEDLHWADPASRDLLRFLLTRLGSDRLLVIGTYRADDLHRRHPLRPLVAELQRLPRVERLDLQPFGPVDLAAFLQSVAGRDLPGDVVDRISDRSAGNAYFAEELLAADARDGVPVALADVLLDRLERLSPPAQAVVRAASVLGSARILDERLRAVAELPGGSEPDDALREAVFHQVLVPDGPDRLAFRHALIQEAVYADLLPGERVRLHRAAARHLAGSTAPDAAAELARHSLAANDLPTALAASLTAAIEAARRSAPVQALADYEQALQLWDAVPEPQRPAGQDPVLIGVAAATAAGDAGLHQRGHALARDALSRAEATGAGPEVTARARTAVAQHLYALDRAADARDVARRAVADLGAVPGASDARVRARVLEIRSDLAFSEAEPALELLPAALAEARDLGRKGAVAELLVLQATAEGMLGRPGSRARWAQARAAAEEAGEPGTLMRVVYNTGVDLIDAGEYPAGIAALEEALDRAAANGLGGSLAAAQTHWQLMTVRWQVGEADAALAVLEDDRRVPPGLLARLRLFALPIRAAREPERLLAPEPVPDADWEQQILQTARADALVWLGRGEEAAEAARAAIGHLDAVNEPYQLAGLAIDTGAVGALADVAARARSRRDEAGAARAAELAAPFLTDARDRVRLGRPRRFHLGPEGLAWVARLDAEEARLHGKDTAAGWAAVAAGFESISVYERARALYRAAAAHVAADEREAARTAVDEARPLAAKLGAAPLAAALDDLARRARLETPRSPLLTVLTPRETDVMRLVAEGLTNRAIGEQLFISEKTVSVHVSNVLAKIGAATRAEAVSIMDRRQLLPD